MATKSPLHRFFKPQAAAPAPAGVAAVAPGPVVASPPEALKAPVNAGERADESSPSPTLRTPGPRFSTSSAPVATPMDLDDVALDSLACAQAVATPPPRRRSSVAAQGDSKRARVSQGSVGPTPAASPDASDATPGGAGEAAAAAAASAPDERETDLRSTLELAQRAAPGGIPPFTAECFCHFASGGAQYSWPQWLVPENLRDAQGRVPTDPQYNQSTLQVPDEKTIKATPTHGTPMLMQYWKLKSAHFDKIAFFKVGKFYELFYYDAFIAQRVCELKWMGEKKPHVGFPEMAKHDYARKIVDAGYKVVVVEQVERVAEQQQRKENKADSGPTCVQRDACEVFTNGTLVDPELLGSAGAKFLLALYFHERTSAAQEYRFAACLIDCATSQIQIGMVNDGPDRNALRTLFAHAQPTEVVYCASNMPSDVLMMVRRMPCRPQQSPVQTLVKDEFGAAKHAINKYKLEYPDKFSDSVQAALADEGVCIVAAGVIAYLGSVLLARRILPFASWELLVPVCEPKSSPSGAIVPAGAGAPQPRRLRKRLVLDATALQALEVLETAEGTYKGSLLEHLNHTGTEFGFRLLKQWLCSPLAEISDIQERQDAIEYFITNQSVANHIAAGFRKIDIDLERATSRVWGFAVQAERHAVYYEDVTAKRLGMFRDLLLAYSHCTRTLLENLQLQGEGVPNRLKQVTRIPSAGGCYPDLQPIITQMLDSVVEDRSGAKVKFRPQAGAYKPYDDLTKQFESITLQLEQELQRVKAMFPNVQFQFCHRLPGWRYEIESDVSGLPSDFLKSVEETKRSSSKVRFQTPTVKKLVAELESAENQREDVIFPFLSQLFQQFHAHQAHFRAAVRCLSEVDALTSMATASLGLPGGSCKAELVEQDDPEAPAILELRSCRHPVAASKMGTSFVPNDMVMNCGDVPGALVVTGPNMGGKSTVLRQTCIAAVMAQVGCRVCAERCRLSPLDRIFTRIGSYDTILEGKSTLLTELEETSAILAHGTNRSLAVLDELGRGTSTFDGAAIASAVLDELRTRVRCLVLFATHYHPISREAAKYPDVGPFHMAAEVDAATNEMTFLYKFLPGLCPASHGHHVARLAGLPAEVLDVALAKSEEFERGNGVAALAGEIARLAGEGDAAALKELFGRLPKSVA